MDTRFLGALRPARATASLVRLALTVLLTALVAAGSAFVTTTPAQAASGSPGIAADDYERQVQYWVNQKRANHDLPRLRLAACTDGTAERWSRHLAANNAFYHQSMQKILERCDAVYAGETLGRGSSMSPRLLVRMWMHSDGHRAVLLSSKARRIGIGATVDGSGRWVVAANFMRF
jgi:uncharacterized protein YkwD